jgi:uncharacterized membrane protein
VFLAALDVSFVLSTVDQLPEMVATHYRFDGRADGWMTRTGYLLFMMGFTLGFAALIAFLIGFLPRRWPHLTNIPNREYWLAEPRREDSVQFLSAHGWWLACLLVLLFAGVHYAILISHRSQPPNLPLSVFLPLLSGFFIGFVIWIMALHRRFHKRGGLS